MSMIAVAMESATESASFGGDGTQSMIANVAATTW
jgi:hypothetical protein